MKLFIKRLLTFISPILIILIVLELLVRNSNSLYKEKWEGYTTNADSIEVLILGSSRALNGVDPKEFDLFTYNMAMGSQSLYFDKEILLKNLNNMSNLKYVIFSLNHHSFYSLHNANRDVFYHYHYGIDFDNNNYFTADLSWLYTFGFKQTIREHIARPKTNSYCGFVTSKETNWNLMNRTSGKKRVEQFKLEFDNKNKIMNNFKNLIETLQNKKITPILITMPCHDYFKEHLDEKLIQKFETNIKEISDLYKIEHWNFFNENFPDSLFKDLDHLNSKGAIKISKKINKMITNDSL